MLVDRPDSDARFLVLGSASSHLLHQTSESLAGRIAYHELGGFSLDEVGVEAGADLWLRGGFPRAFLAAGAGRSAELARAFGVTAATVRRYLDLLTGALVVRQLLPWHENIGKRQVKSPKVYIADSGILHTLFGLESREDLESHPKVGASWEGFVLRELILRLGARPEECFFWATHAGAKLDLLAVRGTRKHGFEIKRTSAVAFARLFDDIAPLG